MNNVMLWFDLEKTIIEDWEKPFTINEDKIKYAIENIEVTSISIFSFAIYNEKDIATFNRIIKPNIEKTFNVIVENVPTYQEMFNTIKKGYGTHFDENDFHDFWSKGRAFIDYIRFSPAFSKRTHILFDDKVEDWEIEHKWLDISIRNIDKYNYRRIK